MADIQTDTVGQRTYAHWPKTALRIGFGVIWLVDALLKWLPGFRAGYMGSIMDQGVGNPGWSRPWFDFWTSLQHPYATFFAYMVAVLETLIALALLAGFARKITYIGAIVLSALIWATVEGFGGPYAAGSADIGTAVIYVLVFAALLAFAYYQGPAPFSVDRWLEKRISWWHWVAEVGNHDQYSLGQSSPSVPNGDAAMAPSAVPTPSLTSAHPTRLS